MKLGLEGMSTNAHHMKWASFTYDSDSLLPEHLLLNLRDPIWQQKQTVAPNQSLRVYDADLATQLPPHDRSFYVNCLFNKPLIYRCEGLPKISAIFNNNCRTSHPLRHFGSAKPRDKGGLLRDLVDCQRPLMHICWSASILAVDSAIRIRNSNRAW